MKKRVNLFLIAIIWLSLPVAQLHAQGPALVSVDAVIEEPFAQTVPILGRLVAKQSGTVAARIGGSVAQVLVAVGDTVEKGQLIATIDTEPLKLQLTLETNRKKEALARIETAKAQFALASQDVKRLSSLKSSASVSKAALDDANQQKNIAFARVSEAEAAVSSSNAALLAAELQLQYGKIIAPFNGTVTDKITEVGSYLQTGSPVVRLISDRQLELEADVPANRLGGLVAGKSIEINLNSGDRDQATVRAIVPEENPRTRTRRVRFNIDLSDKALRLAVEQSVTLHIPAGASRNIVTVHKDAIIRKGGGDTVYSVEEGVAKLKKVTISGAAGGRLEVLTGVLPGEMVVVRGNERLRPDQEVKISKQEPAS